jgi:hypothetical protein
MKCGVIVDQSDRNDTECAANAVLENEGVKLCMIHANAYESEGLLTDDSQRFLADLRKYPSSFQRGDRVRIDGAGHRLNGSKGTVIEHINGSTHVKLDKHLLGAIKRMWFPWGYLVLDRSSIRIASEYASTDRWHVLWLRDARSPWVAVADTPSSCLEVVLRYYLANAIDVRKRRGRCVRLIGPGGIIAAEENGLHQ